MVFQNGGYNFFCFFHGWVTRSLHNPARSSPAVLAIFTVEEGSSLQLTGISFIRIPSLLAVMSISESKNQFWFRRSGASVRYACLDIALNPHWASVKWVRKK